MIFSERDVYEIVKWINLNKEVIADDIYSEYEERGVRYPNDIMDEITSVLFEEAILHIQRHKQNKLKNNNAE